MIKKNKIVSLMLSFLLSVFLLLTFIAIVIPRTLLNESSTARSLRNVGFSDAVYEQIQDSLIDVLFPTGFTNDVINGVFTPYDVYHDLNYYLSSVFAGQVPVLSRNEMMERLDINIDNYLLEIDIVRSEIDEGVIDGIIQAIFNEYDNYVRFPFIFQIARTSISFESYFLLLMIVSGISALLTAGAIYFTNRFTHIALRYIAFSFGTTALMIVAAPLALRIWGGYRRLGISPAFMRDFVIFHIEQTILVSLIGGLLFIALYAIFIWISTRLRISLLNEKRAAREAALFGDS